MTEQERAAALADHIVGLREHEKANGKLVAYHFADSDTDLIADALRAYARPAPADLRESIIAAAVQTGEFGRPGAERFADAVLSLLPQTQAESDIKTAVLRDLLRTVVERICLEQETVPAMAYGGEPRDAVLEYRRGIGWGLRIASAMICGKIGEIGRRDRADGKEG